MRINGTINFHFLLKVLCFLEFFSCCFNFQGYCFLHSGRHRGEISIHNIFLNEVQSLVLNANACAHTHAHTAVLHLQQFGGDGGKESKRKKSFLAVHH